MFDGYGAVHCILQNACASQPCTSDPAEPSHTDVQEIGFQVGNSSSFAIILIRSTAHGVRGA